MLIRICIASLGIWLRVDKRGNLGLPVGVETWLTDISVT